MAFLVSAKSLYFPVPTHSRDVNSRPAMINRSFCMDETPPFALSIHWRTAANEAHDFQVQLHRHAVGLDGEFTQQIPNGGISPTAPLFAIHLDLNRFRHRHSS